MFRLRESRYCVGTEEWEGGEVAFVVPVSACSSHGCGMNMGLHGLILVNILSIRCNQCNCSRSIDLD